MAFKLDKDWVRRSFLVAKDDLDEDDFNKRIFTTTKLKYTDTRPGGNICINPPPAFTRYADIKVRGPLSGSDGMGRYYSEAIDDHSQIIHMRFGVESFNSLTGFFGGFYSSAAGQLARTGRASEGFFYTLGKVAGFVVQLASWKLLAIHFLGAAINFLSKKPNSKFYYSKPAMPLYWNAVTTIVNHMAVNRGIVPRVFGADAQQADVGYEFDDAGRKKMHDLLPTIFNEKGSVDVYALANRAKRLERQRMKKMRDILDNASSLGITDLQNLTRQIYNTPMPDPGGGASPNPNLGEYLKRWFANDASKPKSASNESSSSTETVSDTYGDSASGTDKKQGVLKSLIDFTEAELDDGAAFASFRVNATGPMQESFSNTAGESELQSKLNGMVSDARSKNFSFAEGNLIGGAVGKAVGAVTEAVADFGRGVLDSVQLSGLATLAGAAFVDIPKHWQSSMAQLTRASYTINLISPYGNPLSQLLNLDIPLAMLLAGALPKSTGKQSHAGPFLVELYDRGRCQTRLGIIDSLSITRGTGNVGFNQDGKALGIDVTFSILDMSSIMHMPIVENFSFIQAGAQAIGSAVGGTTGQAVGVAITGGAFDDDTVFSDYLAVLSGMALNDQIYGYRKLKLNLTKKMADFETWKSPAHLASFIGDTFPARLAGMFYRGTDKR